MPAPSKRSALTQRKHYFSTMPLSRSLLIGAHFNLIKFSKHEKSSFSFPWLPFIHLELLYFMSRPIIKSGVDIARAAAAILQEMM